MLIKVKICSSLYFSLIRIIQKMFGNFLFVTLAVKSYKSKWMNLEYQWLHQIFDLRSQKIPCTEDLRGKRKNWRSNVLHPRGSLEQLEAINALSNCYYSEWITGKTIKQLPGDSISCWALREQTKSSDVC